MKILLFSLLTFLFISMGCNSTSGGGPCPETSCMAEKITQFKANEQSIALLTSQINGECVYWFSTTAPFADGTDEVLNKNCEVVCQIGGMRPNSYECLGVANLSELKFDTLWKR